MLGCERLARIWRSSRKRRSTTSVSMPRFTTLIATSFLYSSSARVSEVDGAHPATSDLAHDLVGADPLTRERLGHALVGEKAGLGVVHRRCPPT